MKQAAAYFYMGLFLCLASAVFAGAHSLASSHLAKQAKLNAPAAASCDKPGPEHFAVILDDVISPTVTLANLCDRLTIINRDDKLREMAFGEHDRHQQYDGIYQKNLELNDSFTIVLNRAGNYRLHDHFKAKTAASFTVYK